MKVGGTSGAKCRKFFLVVPLHFFGPKSTIVVLVSAFVMVSTVWSVSCLRFYSLCPRAQSFVKPGCPVPYEVGATVNNFTQNEMQKLALHKKKKRQQLLFEQQKKLDSFVINLAIKLKFDHSEKVRNYALPSY